MLNLTRILYPENTKIQEFLIIAYKFKNFQEHPSFVLENPNTL